VSIFTARHWSGGKREGKKRLHQLIGGFSDENLFKCKKRKGGGSMNFTISLSTGYSCIAPSFPLYLAGSLFVLLQ
jgi:hypothetical protein